MKLMPVFCQADDPSGKSLNVDEVNGADVLPHGGFGSFQDVLGLVLIACDLCHLGQLQPYSLVRPLQAKIERPRRLLLQATC